MKIKSVTAWTSALALSVALLPACGPMKDLQDTKDTTQKMSNTMDYMSGTTKNLRDLTQQVYTMEGITFAGLRESLGAQTRSDAFRTIIHSSDPNEQAAAAGTYVLSFDFQLYQGTGEDNSAMQLNLFYLALNEFFDYTPQFIDHLGALPNTPVLKYFDKNQKFIPINFHTGRNQNALHAMVAALHRVNPLEGGNSVSMLDLITDGVDRFAQKRAGQIKLSDEQDFEQVVDRNIMDAAVILNARAEYLATIALSGLMGLRSTWWPQMKVYFRSISKKKYTPVMNDYVNNEAALSFYQKALNYSIGALQLLNTAGLQPEIDPTIRKALASMDLTSKKSQLKGAPAAAAQTLQECINTFNELATGKPVVKPLGQDL